MRGALISESAGPEPRNRDRAAHARRLRRQRRVLQAVAAEIGVLPAAASHPDVPGQRRQQRHRPHRLARAVMTLQAEPGDEQRRLVARVISGEAVDDGGRHAGDRGDALERVVAKPIQIAVEPVRVLPEERLVVQAGLDDDPRHAERQRRVGARPRLEMDVGGVRGVGASRVDERDHRAAFLGLVDPPHLVDVRLRRVVAPQQDEAAVGGVPRVAVQNRAEGQPRGLEPGRPAEVAVGERAPAELVPEGHRQTAERAVAARRVVVEHRLRAVLPPHRVESRRDVPERFVPRHPLERPVLPSLQWMQQSSACGDPPRVADPLQADVAPRGRVERVAVDAGDAAALVRHHHAARAVAVARAHGARDDDVRDRAGSGWAGGSPHGRRVYHSARRARRRTDHHREHGEHGEDAST